MSLPLDCKVKIKDLEKLRGDNRLAEAWSWNGKTRIQFDHSYQKHPFLYVLQTFVHEMCHIADHSFGDETLNGHTVYWANRMEKLGIKTHYNPNTNKRKYDDETIKGGAFDRVASGLIKEWQSTGDFTVPDWVARRHREYGHMP